MHCGLTFYTHPTITCKTLQMVWGPMKFIESTLKNFQHFFSAKSNFENQSTDPNPHGWLVCSSKIYFDIPKPSAVAQMMMMAIFYQTHQTYQSQSLSKLSSFKYLSWNSHKYQGGHGRNELRQSSNTMKAYANGSISCQKDLMIL